MDSVIQQLNTATGVAAHWHLIGAAIAELNLRGKENIDAEQMFSNFCWLAMSPTKGWIGVISENSKPFGFAALQQVETNDNRKTFQVLLFWHRSGKAEATIKLMVAFESWAIEQGVKKYQVTTRRDTGAAIRCFQSPQYGFKRAFTTYEKTL
jgi:hypothetical protein